jgi:glycosyltransferase involved in cell wall biosynthesis
MEIDVLLATYNGAEFLEEQLKSIVSQTFQSWRVIARDDGSVDATMDILERYAKGFPEKIKIVRDGFHLGARGSFSALMKLSEAPYIAFCDQDDIWLPEKLAVLVSAVKQQEAIAGNEVAVLVHSDLEVVDKKMNRIAASFWAYQGIQPERNKLGQLVLENTVTGCAMLFNRALLGRCDEVPEAAYMHDYWLTLIAAALGRIVFVRESLVRYRQHGNNTLGAVKLSNWISLSDGIRWPAKWRANYVASCVQACALVDVLSGVVSPERLLPAANFAGLYNKGWLGRRILLLRNGSLPAKWRRRIFLMVRI